MKKNLFALTFVIITILGACTPVETKQDQRMLRHVVLFKFTEASTPADVKIVEDAFALLPGKISQIKDYEWGTNSSPENLNQELTHCFFVTFASDKDRDEYLVHPDHVAFVEVLKPHLDKVTVVDYWANK